MFDPVLSQVRYYVVHDDRAAAMAVLRAAIEDSRVPPRDAIELILALRQAPRMTMLEVIDRMSAAPPGTYRYVLAAQNALL